MEENKVVANKESVVNVPSITPPAGEMAKKYMYHLGIILSNLSLFALLLSFLNLFSFLVPVFGFIVLFLMVLFSIGMVFLYIPNFGSWFTSLGDFATKFMPLINKLFPVLLAVSLACAVASMVLLLIDKTKRPWGRISFSIVLISLVVIITIGLIAGLVVIA